MASAAREVISDLSSTMIMTLLITAVPFCLIAYPKAPAGASPRA